jgi:hypothetical protein
MSYHPPYQDFADVQGSLILKLMTEFSRDFVSSIDGTSLEISTKELCGGARVYYIFNEVFGHALQSIDPTENLSLSDIRTAIRNSTGPRPSLFVPEVAFDLLVKPQIKLLEAPSLRCVELVYEELMKICHSGTGGVSQLHEIHATVWLISRNCNDSLDFMLSSSRWFRSYFENDSAQHPNTSRALSLYRPLTLTPITPILSLDQQLSLAQAHRNQPHPKPLL